MRKIKNRTKKIIGIMFILAILVGILGGIYYYRILLPNKSKTELISYLNGVTQNETEIEKYMNRKQPVYIEIQDNGTWREVTIEQLNQNENSIYTRIYPNFHKDKETDNEMIKQF